MSTNSENFKLAGRLLRIRRKKSSYYVRVLIIGTDPEKEAINGKISLMVGDHNFGKVSLRRSVRWPFFLRIITAEVPYKKVLDSKVHNKVHVSYIDNDGWEKQGQVYFAFLSRIRGISHVKARYIVQKLKITLFFRQAGDNTVFLTTRPTIKSDRDYYNRKISLAYYVSFLFFWKKPILLYEKESEKYEESASVLYEKLVDEGYKNIFFVLDSESSHNSFVKPQYRSQIIVKHSFKHYLYFFLTKTFIATEMPGHSIDLRVANRHAMLKVSNNKYKFVFLQHGVMYMISLGSEERRPARKGNNHPNFMRTVVSSELEAKHFVEYGGYSRNDLYITGLAKFDRSVRHETADKITIMPTWRPWEYNQIHHDPKATGYYQMIKEILSGIPEDLHNKVHVLPHPLFIKALQSSDLDKYIKDFKSYDEVLRQTDLLITDYSSIAYDAFYRGSNVVFWWKDKDYCMEQQGGWLMLNESNIFGDVVMNKRDLKGALKRGYGQKQDTKYIKRYHKIVEFSDNKNTERIVEALWKDGVI